MNSPVLLQKFSKLSLPRYTSYPTAPEWSNWPNGSADMLGHLVKVKNQQLSLYIHIPFCAQQCWYCGCNTLIKKKSSHADLYLSYLVKEIDLIVAQVGEKQIRISQVHMGGGTPNFLSEEQIDLLMAKINSAFIVDPLGEFSVEIDPRTCTPEKLIHFSKCGFNRVSMGIQDFNPEVQKAINRIQPYEKVVELVKTARECNFKSLNFDLVYGLPHQTKERFTNTLTKTLELKPDRLALYSFAYLPHVKNHMKLIKAETLPLAEDKLELFMMAWNVFKENGYLEIAMDHFAREGDELATAMKEGRLHRNFMGYTTQNVENSLGLGVSSISYLNNSYIQNSKELKDYYAALDEDLLPVSKGKTLGLDDLARKWVISELMCNMIVSKDEFKSKFGAFFDDYFAAELEHMDECEKLELLKNNSQSLKVIGQGQLLVRYICSGFDAYLKKSKRLFSSLV